jgi:hypothetical protein
MLHPFYSTPRQAKNKLHAYSCLLESFIFLLFTSIVFVHCATGLKPFFDLPCGQHYTVLKTFRYHYLLGQINQRYSI